MSSGAEHDFRNETWAPNLCFGGDKDGLAKPVAGEQRELYRQTVLTQRSAAGSPEGREDRSKREDSVGHGATPRRVAGSVLGWRATRGRVAVSARVPTAHHPVGQAAG